MPKDMRSFIVSYELATDEKTAPTKKGISMWNAEPLNLSKCTF